MIRLIGNELTSKAKILLPTCSLLNIEMMLKGKPNTERVSASKAHALII